MNDPDCWNINKNNSEEVFPAPPNKFKRWPVFRYIL